MANEPTKPFLLFLAGVAILADLATLVQFTASGTALKFWSFQWIMGVVFIVLLLGVGFVLLMLANEEERAKQIIPIFGGIYGVLLTVLYVFFGFQQIQAAISTYDYMGFIVLFLVMLIIFSVCLDYGDEKKHFKISSYGFALCNLVFMIMMVNKYVFNGFGFEFWVFLGELVILIGGAILFVGFHSEGDK